MSSLQDMRNELRSLRKETVRPISKMRKGDISAELERMKVARAETPAAAAVPSAPLKKSKAAIETIKEAKASEFPVKPVEAKDKKVKAAAPKTTVAPKKKSSKMEKLMKMMEAMSDSE